MVGFSRNFPKLGKSTVAPFFDTALNVLLDLSNSFYFKDIKYEKKVLHYLRYIDGLYFNEQKFPTTLSMFENCLN